MQREVLDPSRADVDFLPLLGTDHIEFYVGNAKQSAYYYQMAWGYELIAYAGPETGVREKASYVLKQGKITLILTTALQPDSEIADHVKAHGDGVKYLSLWVDDAPCGYVMLTGGVGRPKYYFEDWDLWEESKYEYSADGLSEQLIYLKLKQASRTV